MKTKFLMIGLLCVMSTPAFAYIDPGTGSMFIQAAIATIAGMGVTAKLYWQKIKSFFMRKKELPPEDKENSQLK